MHIYAHIYALCVQSIIQQDRRSVHMIVCIFHTHTLKIDSDRFLHMRTHTHAYKYIISIYIFVYQAQTDDVSCLLDGEDDVAYGNCSCCCCCCCGLCKVCFFFSNLCAAAWLINQLKSVRNRKSFHDNRFLRQVTKFPNLFTCTDKSVLIANLRKKLNHS